MTKSEASKLAQRKANELQCNYIVYRQTRKGPQWMCVEEKYVETRCGKSWSFYEKQIVPPTYSKSNFTLVDSIDAATSK